MSGFGEREQGVRRAALDHNIRLQARQMARDFAAVVPLGVTANVLVVSPARGFKTARDLAAAAKAKPGSLTFASAGVGSGTHLSAERFLASVRESK
jgi:tripartite-type tricarboxylate transporter receptor subunit TctC